MSQIYQISEILIRQVTLVDQLSFHTKVSFLPGDPGGSVEFLTQECLFYQGTLVAQLGVIGGTMGLFTGFSILSGIEILYFATKSFFKKIRSYEKKV